MRAFATLLALAASAAALQVTQPTNSTGFSTDGQNTVAWNAVSTDPANFTIVLVNMNVFPNYQQVLNALVVSSLGKIQVNAPSEGWPAAGVPGYQINLVRDSENLQSILAQSDDFTFHAPKNNATNSSSSALSSPAVITVGPTAATTSPSNPSSGDQSLNPSTSDTGAAPTNTNAASSAMGMQAALLGAVAFVGALFA
jgi:hypothetical protein